MTDTSGFPPKLKCTMQLILSLSKQFTSVSLKWSKTQVSRVQESSFNFWHWGERLRSWLFLFYPFQVSEIPPWNHFYPCSIPLDSTLADALCIHIIFLCRSSLMNGNWIPLLAAPLVLLHNRGRSGTNIFKPTLVLSQHLWSCVCSTSEVYTANITVAPSSPGSNDLINIRCLSINVDQTHRGTCGVCVGPSLGSCQHVTSEELREVHVIDTWKEESCLLPEPGRLTQRKEGS